MERLQGKLSFSKDEKTDLQLIFILWDGHIRNFVWWMSLLLVKRWNFLSRH